MKLVLCSSSAHGEIKDKICEFVGKPAKNINICIIAEAHSVESSCKRDWLIKGFGEIAEDFGGKIDMFSLLALDIKEIEKRINKTDVIWCFGGNTDFLQYVFDKSGFSKLLSKLLKTKVWVGSSAGSMVLCKRPISYKTRKDNYGVAEYLGFNNFCIHPHVHTNYTPKSYFNECVAESKKTDHPVYALSDDSAVIVEGSKVFMMGKNSQVLVNGKIINEI